MDVTTVNWAETMTSVMAIIVALGGAGSIKYIGKALGGVSATSEIIKSVSDCLKAMSKLLIAISEAGADGKLTEDEWKNIRETAIELKTEIDEIKECADATRGKFGDVFKV